MSMLALLLNGRDKSSLAGDGPSPQARSLVCCRPAHRRYTVVLRRVVCLRVHPDKATFCRVCQPDALGQDDDAHSEQAHQRIRESFSVTCGVP